LFFVLSGFLISLPFFRRIGNAAEWCPPGYALRRAAKVIPPFYVSVAIFTTWMIAQTHSLRPLMGAAETMAFVQIFRPPDPMIEPIYWTLAAEVAFYGTLPALFITLRGPLKKAPVLVPLIYFLAATLALAAVASHPNLITNTLIRDVLLSFGFFSWGAAFAAFQGLVSRIPQGACAAIALLGLLLFAACCAVSTHYWLVHQIELAGNTNFEFRFLLSNAVAISAVMMLFVIRAPHSWIDLFLSHPAMTLAGLVSYEWYLFHLLFIGISNSITGTYLHGRFDLLWIRIFFAFPVAFAFSAAFYRWVSLPILRRAHAATRA
jgi:peptidoglycan/LPS O-acetylase OafA/YrhL